MKKESPLQRMKREKEEARAAEKAKKQKSIVFAPPPVRPNFPEDKKLMKMQTTVIPPLDKLGSLIVEAIPEMTNEEMFSPKS